MAIRHAQSDRPELTFSGRGGTSRAPAGSAASSPCQAADDLVGRPRPRRSSCAPGASRSACRSSCPAARRSRSRPSWRSPAARSRCVRGRSLPVVDVDLDAADRLALELGEGGREVRLPEVHAGQPAVRPPPRPTAGRCPPRRAVRRAGSCRAPRTGWSPRTGRCPSTRARCPASACWGSAAPRAARRVEEVRPPPPVISTVVQRHRRRRQELAVEQQRQLRHRHPVRLRDRLPADEGRELLVQHGARGRTGRSPGSAGRAPRTACRRAAAASMQSYSVQM